MFTLGYRPWLDGIRAVAIIAVFGYHLSRLQSVIKGTGASGLDVFFVLSGFLITTLLLEERARTGGISLRAFYLRRARRLLPALGLLIVGIIVLSFFGLREFDGRNVFKDVFAVAFYIGNWVKALTNNQLGLLGHTWSLSVEEQFYLVWPLLLIVVAGWKIVGGRLLVLIGVATVASIAVYETLNGTADPPRVYFGTDTRGYAILLGCAVAVVMHHGLQPKSVWWERVRTVVGVAAAAFLLAYFLRPSLLSVDQSWPLELVPLATALLILHLCSAPDGWLHAALSVTPLVWIGRVSYGLYLYHFPVIELLTPDRTGLDGGALALVDIAVTAVLTIASWVLVERRFLQRRAYVSRPMASEAAL